MEEGVAGTGTVPYGLFVASISIPKGWEWDKLNRPVYLSIYLPIYTLSYLKYEGGRKEDFENGFSC